MNREYQLHVQDDSTDIMVHTIDPTEIARIVSLAGITPSAPSVPAPAPEPAPIQTVPTADSEAIHCNICGETGHDESTCPQAEHPDEEPAMEIDEDQAEFDYGSQDVDLDGEEVDPDTYTWQGPKSPQRITKGGHGDNPLISELHQTLIEKYKNFLAEMQENEDGSLSPLSDPTKPEFDKDPLSNEEPVTDGSRSPMSTVKRQPALK